ncbi:MAG: T9SS type A sorting domain-containing protein, partial [Ignavibacteriaceae bacterium]|nr:T9SS type A sorting domain-containing protein [Ignavibacteriaceae bacterium]
MKNIIKFFLMLGLLGNLSFSQINWELDYESANFAFLKVNFNTYDFEGGYFTKFDYHPGFDLTGIPFSIVYNPPLDTGDILFAYSATNDTIFAASIWWLGQGQILFPDSIDDASQFTYDSSITINPFTIDYYNYVEEIEDSVFHQKADSAWLSIKQLSILEKFDTLGSVFRVGLYLYAPAVGSFNPDVAKWIIFLYRGQLIVGVENEIEIPNHLQLYQNYPNPFNPTTTIEYSIPERTEVRLTVVNIVGEEVATLVNQTMDAGNYRIEFNAAKLPSGVYFYELR